MEARTVISQFEVKDFAGWLEAFELYAPERKAAGLVSSKIYRVAATPGVVFAILEWRSEDAAKAYVEGLAIKAKMMDAGVVGLPQFHFVSEA
jgi:quinol monooxygenase YgiN